MVLTDSYMHSVKWILSNHSQVVQCSTVINVFKFLYWLRPQLVSNQNFITVINLIIYWPQQM